MDEHTFEITKTGPAAAARVAQTLRQIADHMERGGFSHVSGAIQFQSSGALLHVESNLVLMWVKEPPRSV